MSAVFDFSQVVKTNAPPALSPWRKFPEYNFVGGHNDPDSLPLADLLKACNSVLQREGKTLATYSLESGPQGYMACVNFWCTS